MDARKATARLVGARPPFFDGSRVRAASSRSMARGMWSLSRCLVWSLLALVLAVILGHVLSQQNSYIAVTVAITAVGAVALNMLTGTAGLVSIGNAAYLGVGSYTAVILAGHLPFLVVAVIGGMVAGVIGLLIGIPSLRLRGLYLVFSTLALQEIAQFAFSRYDDSHHALAGNTIATATIGPLTIDSNQTWLIVATILLILVVVGARALLVGKPGRAWSAVARNDVAAAIMGIDVTRAKLSAFVYSSSIIGVAGVFLAYFLGNVSNTYFSLELAISYAVMILIGGLGSIGGAIAGATFVTVLPRIVTFLASVSSGGSANESLFVQRNLAQIEILIYGLCVMIFMFAKPDGLAGVWKSLARPIQTHVLGGKTTGSHPVMGEGGPPSPRPTRLLARRGSAQ